MRADMQLGVVIDPGDGAAAIADFDQVDHRHHDRITRRGTIALNPIIGHDFDLAILDQRAFGSRPADIKRQHIVLADHLTEFRRTPEARGRAGFDHGDGNPRHRVQRIHAAIGLHDIGAALEAARRDTLIEPLEVSRSATGCT
ncbi:MAG: hypothetical protein HoeaKO_05080 [Hoeflea alexandrii]